MTKNLFLTLAILVSISATLWAQTDVVSGNAKTYAGDTLRMYSINDYISNTESLLATAVVDKDGNFSFNAKIKEVTQAYIDLSVFKCMLYLQPNTRQTIVLPEKQTIKPEDELNPFFRKYEFYAKLINPSENDLNVIIPAFDKVYQQALNRILSSQYGYSKKETDTIESKIAAQFKSSNPFFQSYMRYRFAMLDHTAYHRNPNIIIKEFFAGKEVLSGNPAYNDLFNEMYSNIFARMKDIFISHTDKHQAISHRSYHSLKKSLAAEEKVGSEKLADYIILKGLKDAYYTDTIAKENLISVADSMSIACKTKEFRNIASSLSEEFTKLMCGYPAPAITISDMQGKEYEIASFSGKFSYIIFFNPNSYTAQNDLELLMNIRGAIPPEVLEIVLVFVSQSKDSYYNFNNQLTEDLGFPTYWYNGNTDMLKKYNVRAFPMYYLVGPEGNLSMNPAPAPTEFFKQKFDATYRNWKNDQYRKEYRNKQGIR